MPRPERLFGAASAATGADEGGARKVLVTPLFATAVGGTFGAGGGNGGGTDERPCSGAV